MVPEWILARKMVSVEFASAKPGHEWNYRLCTNEHKYTKRPCAHHKYSSNINPLRKLKIYSKNDDLFNFIFKYVNPHMPDKIRTPQLIHYLKSNTYLVSPSKYIRKLIRQNKNKHDTRTVNIKKDESWKEITIRFSPFFYQ